MRFGAVLRLLAVALLLTVATAAAVPAQAQQVNPTAQSVREQQFLEALKGNPQAELQGRITIPDQRAATLERPAGRDWRAFHQGTMLRIATIVVLGMLALLVAFYLIRGRVRMETAPAGQTITRFNGFERFMHWLTAACFVLLAFSGLNVTFGKHVLLPLIGPNAFTNLSVAAKWAHNFLAWPFMLGIALMFVVWIKDNIPSMVDVRWFLAGGGIVGNGHPPARRFNGGQKALFWAVVLGGAALSVSGFYLIFPALAGGVLNLQFWNVVHGIVSVLLIAAILGHIYIGTIGMEGAFDAMGSGEVDLNWAKAHHSLWVEEEVRKGHVAPGRPALQPAE
ncbi:MAG TPA: formate dehydrogenase subunit gamma [Bosea sp. (in: a-proteobacteria)]|jgi:formate dehydrogenase subunit gamma|uniref:formate dehydrogenase subunit gamma n=1 Tax=Bosea sp. (in: a-proteobacteria) TaxID=1871050 RepID=UPI002E10C0C6|nr:formate dehydrogenase subunit gamma [Bosea sp. (in: a-proteobacteria)]